MAKYEVVHSCLHSQTHVLFGPNKDRERKLEWLATTLCTECYHAKLVEDREAASKQCHEWSKVEGLSPLVGTPKQIAWAETLRASMLGNARIEADRIKSRIDLVSEQRGADKAQAAWAAILDSLTWISQQDQAKFWIDNRDRPAAELILLCPYVAEHLPVLVGERQASRIEEKQAEVSAEAAKKAEEAAKQKRINDRRESDRRRFEQLFGSGFALAVKTDSSKKRVYIGGYPAAATYFATGDRYNAADSLAIGKVVSKVAERLSVTEDEARQQVLEFCRDLCKFWNSLRIN